MISKMVSVFLVGLVLHGSIAAQTLSSPTQDVTKMQQVLRSVQEQGKAITVTLSRKIDNKTKLTGKVSEVSDTSFTLTNQRTGNPMTLAYEDVQQVKHKGMSKGAKIAVGVGIGAAIFVAVGILACFASGQCQG
jgi:hypothetical protein